MSEKEKLQKAAPKKEIASTKKEDVTVKDKSIIENPPEDLTPSQEENIPQEEDKNEIVKKSKDTTSKTQKTTKDNSSEDNEDATPKKDVEDEVDADNSENAKNTEVEATKKPETEEQEKPTGIVKKDYQTMSMEDLVDELEKLVEKEKIQEIKSQAETIKSIFSIKFSAFLQDKKAKFLAEGGNTIDFQFNSPLKSRFNEITKTFRNKRQAYYKNLEKSLKENLETRLEIITQIKGLINVEENINTTYKHFKSLQESWRNIGPIPRDKYNNVWNNYHHHVEIFYDFLHLNRDLRDLDFKHNLEQKLKLIARAEELAQDDDSNRAFRELQVLHKIWKDELGPVNREQREDIWDRFSLATKTIHEKRQVFFGELDKVYLKNLEIKHSIIEQITGLTNEEAKSYSVWQKRIKTVEDLRNQFFKAGKVPIKVNEETWGKFKTSVRDFNRNKNMFYKSLKKNQYENLQKKIALIKVADDYKDNTDFEKTTVLMKKIQNDWKNIGHVPRKDSDKIWNQFKSSCNHYFNKLHAVHDEANKEEIESLIKKSELLKKLKSIEFSDDSKQNITVIKDYIKDWKTLGNVPFNKRFINGKFNKAIDVLFNKLNISKSETELLKYDNKLESLSNKDDKRLLDNEHAYLRKKIDDVRGEINQLENNLQFFSNVDETNPLVKEVYQNIENHKSSLSLWERKLKKVKEYY